MVKVGVADTTFTSNLFNTRSCRRQLALQNNKVVLREKVDQKCVGCQAPNNKITFRRLGING